jgi:hypothetical protein
MFSGDQPPIRVLSPTDQVLVPGPPPLDPRCVTIFAEVIPLVRTSSGGRLHVEQRLPYAPTGSLQLRVLRLGLLQDGNVGIGVFPDSEEASLRQSHATQNVCESGVGAEWRKAWTCFQKKLSRRAVINSLVH